MKSMFILFDNTFVSHDYNHAPLPIVMRLGVNVFGIKAKQRICKDFSISHLFQNGARFVCLFCSYSQTPDRFS